MKILGIYIDNGGAFPYLRAGAIAQAKITQAPRGGMSADGYTTNAGAGSEYMIRLHSCKVWRRVYVLQFSNAASFFVNIDKRRIFLHNLDEVRGAL
jgi:hypothetical protein